MIAGYFDNDARVFCARCWSVHAEAGARPAEMLDSEDPLEPENNFWIVDECADCGGRVTYLSAVAVN